MVRHDNDRSESDVTHNDRETNKERMKILWKSLAHRKWQQECMIIVEIDRNVIPHIPCT